MPLKIKVTGRYAKAFKDNAQKVFTVHGGTIGRGTENDWVLPDPHRHISSKHAAILNKDGHYFILDTSTNGVFLNDASSRIGRGNSARLKHGDTFRISDYVFQISLEEDVKELAQEDDPAKMTLSEKDEMISFAALLEDDLSANNSNLPTPAEIAQRERDFADEFLAETIAPDSLDEKPEGWELMDLPDTSIVPPPVKAPDSSVELLPPEDIRARRDLDLSLADENLDELQAQDVESELALSDDFPGSGSTIAQADEPQTQPPARPTPEVRPLPDPPSSVAAPGNVSDSGSFSGSHRGDPVLIFLQAAGVNIDKIKPQAAAQIMQNAGQLLREFVVGAMDSLVTRSEIKNTLRLPRQTTIQSGHYNPLRFSAGVDESLRALLLENGRRHLSPVDAVRQSFHDLRVHELAMAAALKEAVQDLYDRFDPVELEDRFDRGMKRGPILGKTNKLKYWELFADLYNAMAEGRIDGIPHVFADEFSRAYEMKVQELSNHKGNPDSHSKTG